MEKKEKHFYLNRIPLFAQLIALMFLLVVFLVLCIYGSVFKKSRRQLQIQLHEASDKLLRIELTNLEEYIDTLTNFCLQPCYDSTFYQYLTSRQPLAPQQLDYIKDQMKYYYYSMDNINQYHLYLANQDIEVFRNTSNGRFEENDGSNFRQTLGFEEYLNADSNYAIYPTGDDSTFLTYYHSIIRIEDRSVQAVASVTIDNSYISTLLKNHSSNGEFICILNRDNELLFSSNPTLLSTTNEVAPLVSTLDSDMNNIEVNNDKYIVNIVTSDTYGLKILSFLPLSYLNKISFQLLNSSLVIGITICIAACVLILVLVRLATSPLTTLAKRLATVAAGNSSSKLNLNGSLEITNLCNSYNTMLEHTNQLIKANTIAELKLKTSTMKILTLQINPHFIYNAMQSITSEAVNSNEPKVLKMSQCLTNILNYLNSNGDYASIIDEISYMKDYLYLKEVQMEQSIQIDYLISTEYYQLAIPKGAFQILMFPIIQYGMRDETIPLHLSITLTQDKHNLMFVFESTGCGISENYIVQLNEQMSSILNNPEQINGNPVFNLYYRLSILYANQFSLHFESKESEFTRIHLTIPVMDELTES